MHSLIRLTYLLWSSFFEKCKGRKTDQQHKKKKRKRPGAIIMRPIVKLSAKTFQSISVNCELQKSKFTKKEMATVTLSNLSLLRAIRGLLGNI
jgi:hypothetical protein